MNQAFAAADVYVAAIVLFMRVLQRDQSERPKIHAEPGVGQEWLVCVYIGDVPPKLAAHYARQAVGASSKATPLREGEQDPDVQSRMGRAPTVEGALQIIVDELALKLRQRMAADAGAHEIAFGFVPLPPEPMRPPTPKADADEHSTGALARRPR